MYIMLVGAIPRRRNLSCKNPRVDQFEGFPWFMGISPRRDKNLRGSNPKPQDPRFADWA